MKEQIENKYVKRTQKDYSYSFKLQIIKEIEHGKVSVKEVQLRYGIQPF